MMFYGDVFFLLVYNNMRCSKKPFVPPIWYSPHGLLIMKIGSNTIEYLAKILKVMKMISMPCHEYFITYIFEMGFE
jgi:hypothetical protein